MQGYTYIILVSIAFSGFRFCTPRGAPQITEIYRSASRLSNPSVRTVRRSNALMGYEYGQGLSHLAAVDHASLWTGTRKLTGWPRNPCGSTLGTSGQLDVF